MVLLIAIIFLIFLPLGQWVRLDLGNGLSLVPLDLGVFTLSVVYFLTGFKKIHGFLLKPFLIFILFLVISLLLNYTVLETRQFLVSAAYLIRLISYISIYFIVLGNKRISKIIPKLITISGLFLLIIGFSQYIFYPDLRNLYYLGWDEHLYRLFSSFLDPNFAGSFFVIYLMFLLVSFKNKVNKFIFILSFIAIFLTYSRSAYIMLIISVVIFLVLKKKLKLILSFIVLFIVCIFILSKTSLSSEGTNLLRTASGEARLDSAKIAIDIFKKNPVFGVGFDAYRYAQHRYGFLNKNWENVHSGAGTDNSFLFILATSGVLGFASFLYLIFEILKGPLAVKSKYSAVVFSVVVGLIFNSLFVNSLFYPAILLLLLSLLGIRESR